MKCAGRKRRISPILVTEPENTGEVILCVRPTPDYPRPGRRVLLRYDAEGLWLFCRFCKQEHSFPWHEVETCRSEAQGGTEEAGGETCR